MTTPAQVQREREREQMLADKIRNGWVSPDEVRAEVRESVREKLLVANPRYLPES